MSQQFQNIPNFCVDFITWGICRQNSSYRINRRRYQRLTHDVNVSGKILNLRLNVKKTIKLLVAGKNPGTNYNILIYGEEVDEVENFKYLGSMRICTANCTRDIKTRIAIAKRRISEWLFLQNLWNGRNITTCLKMKLFKTFVCSALLYGAESWTLLKADEIRIMAPEMWFGGEWSVGRRKEQISAKHHQGASWKGGQPKGWILWPW